MGAGRIAGKCHLPGHVQASSAGATRVGEKGMRGSMDKQTFLSDYSVDRHGSLSLKWDLLEERYGNPNLVPMWVADMDFKVCDSITKALQERVDHGVYGYTYIPDAFYDSFFAWEKKHFDVELQREWVRSTTNIVQALFHLIQIYTEPDDTVAILTPVFTPFHYSVRDCGRRLTTIPLTYEDGRFDIDLARFEEAIVDSKAKLYIHCNPHNPAGRVWTEQEQAGLFEICRKHGVIIVNDEVHQDFVWEGHKHVSALNVANGAYRDIIVTVNSGSKTFNIAGLIQSVVIISNPDLRARYDAFASMNMVTEFNLLGLTATAAGYEGGEEWFSALREVIWDNYVYLRDRLAEEAPEIVVPELEGTYLAFVDLAGILDGRSTREVALERCGLAVNWGETFGVDYSTFVRLNLATTPENIKKTVDALVVEAKAVRG